jgi:hypothetical protein
VWQAVYFWVTEVKDVAFLNANPDVMTTLRWLSQDRKNPMYKVVLFITRKMRVMGKKEHFDYTTFKTQIVFMIAQFVFTLASVIPSLLMYYSLFLHVALLVFFLTVAVFNGAGYASVPLPSLPSLLSSFPSSLPSFFPMLLPLFPPSTLHSIIPSFLPSLLSSASILKDTTSKCLRCGILTISTRRPQCS